MARIAILFLFLFFSAAVEGLPNTKKVKCHDDNYPQCYKSDLYCPADCPETCVVDCSSCQAVCNPPPPPRRLKSPPPPYIYSSPPPPPYIYSSPPPPPPYIYASPPPPPPATLPPSPPTPTPSTPTPPTSPPPSSEASGQKKARCKNRSYPHCYGMELSCPSSCPDHCEVDCVTCSPVCNCNRPGSVCQDPKFVGGDGITFYFHGKKDQDFCIVTDSNLHINAHFIGRRNVNMKRDFTWVQSLGILFDSHKLFIGAQKTATWNDAIDRLSVSLDDETILLSNQEGATWRNSTSNKEITITRTQNTNAVEIEVPGNFKIKAVVVPITEMDSRIHNYGITQEDCFAHLDLSFKFYALSGDVNGVLGQTYSSNYVSKVKMGAAMPVFGGVNEFASSNIFSTDCQVARFSGESDGKDDSSLEAEVYASMMRCGSDTEGGVVCKR
ncbi:hypothetical protein IC582_028563 [Cucumis melo]|uniref:Uncharacterized protein LOC103500203 n=2 Tax=Cucumis melo TaxID=3656 RepID=A0A1S3CF01_CUCME|nr:uncharacterized protein LOC103500203 [Cucumis melo]KAA0038827.1 TGF-beta-activated kinase 1 and MAP3K7-binding protein 3-like [Cucumis melo var. makuwa]TYK25769.1 TGF-beta-activated kinase 1 and MAP3K7-binding protein 3-like [Cucumis melo var. makuwa]